MSGNDKLDVYANFEIFNKLNQGGYGIIMNGRRKSDGREFVFKFFGYTENKPDREWIVKEINNLRALDGISGVAQFECIFLDSAKGYINDPRQGLRKKYREEFPVIVMEKLNGGDLCDRILSKCSSDERRFTERDASIIFTNFIVALNEMHYDAKMINCDLKTENLVFLDESDDYHVKIIDFGMAIILGDALEHYDVDLLGTRAYLAPETILAREQTGKAVYSRATDIWQAGCILYIILTAQYPFGDVGKNNKNFQEVRNYIIQGKFAPLDPRPSPEAEDLLNRIFTVNPAQRITGIEILQHPWIENNATVQETDLGFIYKDRIKGWVLRRKFKNFILENVVGSTNRKQALERIFEKALQENRVKEAEVPMAKPAQHSTTRIGRNPTIAFGTAEVITITAEDITKLKKGFVEHAAKISLTASSLPGENKRRQSIQAQNTLAHEGINYEIFCSILRSANHDFLATSEVFDIFDWDKSGTVDYFEFLLTLSSFRTDLDWSDVNSCARIYFDIFDMHNSNSISRDVLVLIMSKLLEDPSGEEMVMETVEHSTDAFNLDYIIQCVDTNGDGEVSFEEFQNFFDVVLMQSSVRAGGKPH